MNKSIGKESLTDQKEADRVFSLTALNVRELLPANDGCRLRMAGLLHNMGDEIRVRYFGCRQHPGGDKQSSLVFDNVLETVVPLDPESFHRIKELQQLAPGDSMMECAFSSIVSPSGDYIQELKACIKGSDIVMISQPWVYGVCRAFIDRSRQLLVYDAHNIECLLRKTPLSNTQVGRQVITSLARMEQQLSREAHLILTCTHKDRQLAHRIFGVSQNKIFVYPNGCFTPLETGLRSEIKSKAKSELRINPDLPVALFVGSNWGPNVAAAGYIIRQIATTLPGMTFLIAGSVGEAFEKESIPSNVRLFSSFSDREKGTLMASGDLALNPIQEGSGSNVKLFEYMYYGLPVITTPIGARGINDYSPIPCVVVEIADFAEQISRLCTDEAERKRLGRQSIELVNRNFSWEQISAQLGAALNRRMCKFNDRVPRISVIVCTYERHDRFEVLLGYLRRQKFRDFEVIVVDQSSESWQGRPDSSGLDMFYFHKKIPGLTAARNTACLFARGEILAFTDDDCEPDGDWLLNAEMMFSKQNVIGVEGRIHSNSGTGTDYRVLTNEGRHGLCFMGANLFIRRNVFQLIDGFDESFGKFFREDTDLAWRALEHGIIEYCDNAVVHHPPMLIDNPRESEWERAKYFVNDPLLMRKHPRLYKELFFFENHWQNNPLFWKYFFEGARIFDVEPPNWVIDCYKQTAFYTNNRDTDENSATEASL